MRFRDPPSTQSSARDAEPRMCPASVKVARTPGTTSNVVSGNGSERSRAWVVKRRERTRQLIELGGLVAKSGLVELTGDDRAALFGLLVEAATKLNQPDRDEQLVIWRRRGKRAFEDSGVQ